MIHPIIEFILRGDISLQRFSCTMQTLVVNAAGTAVSLCAVRAEARHGMVASSVQARLCISRSFKPWDSEPIRDHTHMVVVVLKDHIYIANGPKASSTIINRTFPEFPTSLIKEYALKHVGIPNMI